MPTSLQIAFPFVSQPKSGGKQDTLTLIGYEDVYSHSPSQAFNSNMKTTSHPHVKTPQWLYSVQSQLLLLLPLGNPPAHSLEGGLGGPWSAALLLLEKIWSHFCFISPPKSFIVDKLHLACSFLTAKEWYLLFCLDFAEKHKPLFSFWKNPALASAVMLSGWRTIPLQFPGPLRRPQRPHTGSVSGSAIYHNKGTLLCPEYCGLPASVQPRNYGRDKITWKGRSYKSIKMYLNQTHPKIGLTECAMAYWFIQ